MFKKILSSCIIACFFLSTLSPLPTAHADNILSLPQPGTMVNLSPSFEPVLIKGLKVHPENPFLFDFIIDTGNSNLNARDTLLREESSKLIKYFLASLTVPDKDLWVNLSPYEKDRMIAPNLGQTEMGRDMLAQDYILKQLTASLIYPEKNLGKTFWDEVYAKSQEMYKTTEIPVNTFNKVWIVADKANVFERNNAAYVVGAHLKVMLEEDYLALSHHVIPAKAGIQNTAHSVASQLIRSIILPEIEKEVNSGKNFAPLRQMFYSMILSSWYKTELKNAILTQIYGNQSKVKVGVNQADPKANEAIFQQYLLAYKKGVFNYIKEDIDQATKEPSARKYFSGGEQIWGAMDHAMRVDSYPSGALEPSGRFVLVSGVGEPVNAAMSGEGTASATQDDGIVWRPEEHGFNLDNTNAGRLVKKMGFQSYDELLTWSHENPDAFWNEIAQQGGDLGLDWYKPYDTVRTPEGSKNGDKRDRWFVGGKINIYYNAVERHLKEHGDELAIIWRGEEEGARRQLTYKELDTEVGRMAAALQKLGVKQGEPVGVVMSSLPETTVALLAIWKLGAVVDPIFAAFGPKLIADRLQDANVKVVLTVDGVFRAGKLQEAKNVEFKKNPVSGEDEKIESILSLGKTSVDEALKQSPSVKHVIVLRSLTEEQMPLKDVPMTEGRDLWWSQVMDDARNDPVPATAVMDAEAPAIYHYSSGTTGKPKGLILTQAGLLTSISKEHAYHLDLKPGDRFAGWDDMGWMMGPWKVIGVLTQRATMVIVDGALDKPQGRLWRLIQEEKITHLGFSPGLIRQMSAEPGIIESIDKYDLSSIRIYASAGSPWDETTWLWFFNNVAKREKPIVNFSGGTDLYGGLVSNSPLTPMKPMSMYSGLGTNVAAFDDDNKEADSGRLVWLYPFGPSETNGMLNDPNGEKFEASYFMHSARDGKGHRVWEHGDKVYREGNFWWITGRIGDTFKVDGKWVGSGDIENAVMKHPAVMGVVAIGVPHPKKDYEPVVFYVLKPGIEPSEAIENDIRDLVVTDLGKTFSVRFVHQLKAIPINHANKSLHRLLRDAWEGKVLGDTTTAAEAADGILAHVRELGEIDRANKAMLDKDELGGIDLSRFNMQMNINKEGAGVQMQFNSAMIAEIKRNGFEGIDFQIKSITQFTSLQGMLGLKEENSLVRV